MGDVLPIPPIYPPFAAAIHPAYAEIDHRTGAWAERFEIGSTDLRRRLTSHEIGVFAARILPQGQQEVVQILADFVLWLFGVDDGHCEEGALGCSPGDLVPALSRLLRIAQNPQVAMCADDPIAAGLRDLSRRIARQATPGQVSRWIDGLREYFMSVTWEAVHRSRGTIPSLNDYTLMRIYDGATSVVPPLLEMGHGYELRSYERDRIDVRAAVEMAYFLIAQRDRVMTLWLGVTAHLASQGSPQLRQYLRSLGHFIRATQDWGISSIRYTTPDDPADLPSGFTSTPTDDNADALPIPVIAWWWDLDPPASHRDGGS